MRKRSSIPVVALFVASSVYAQFTQQGPKLAGSDTTTLAAQGQSITISADGNTAVVGAPFDNGSVGAALIFVRSGGIWTQQGPKLV